MKPLSWLAPLVPLYGAIVRGKNVAYDHGLFSARKLEQPVVSIGNLSTGGSGKTPAVIALANLLTANGISVDVLSRGYGRTSDETLVVPATGDADVERYGDEPLMVARFTGVPVFVGRSRLAAGLLAEQSSASQTNHIHLLDDGFQHRQLARALDVVVLHASDLAAKQLPAGHLREPLSSLGRAQAAVVREEDRGAASEVRKYLRADAQVWQIRRTLACELSSGPVVAFCGIAKPEEFFAGLRALGAELAATLPFPDHHRYSESDLLRLADTARKARAVRLVTTEKDAIRLSSRSLGAFSDGLSLTVAKLEATFLEPKTVLKSIRAVLAKPSPEA